jgi:hypothetical protein
MIASTALAIPFVPVFYVATQRLAMRKKKSGGEPPPVESEERTVPSERWEKQ